MRTVQSLIRLLLLLKYISIKMLSVPYRRIALNEVKYLRGQLSADDLVDQSIHFFVDLKIKKYRKAQKNKLLQKLLDEIESQGVNDVLAEVNAEEGDLFLSDEEDDERPVSNPLANVIVADQCPVCLAESGRNGPELHFYNFECGHKVCEECIPQLFREGPNTSCPFCRAPITLKAKRRVFNNDYVVRSTQDEAQAQAPRVLTPEERRQENVLLMAARLNRDPSEPVAPVDDSDTELDRVIAEEEDEEVLLVESGNASIFLNIAFSKSFASTVKLHFQFVCKVKYTNPLQVRMLQTSNHQVTID